MGGTSVVHYEGREFICTGEPEYIGRNEDGTVIFSGFRELYLCDPDKNTECLKGGCQIQCRHTLNEEFKKEEINGTR